MFQPQHALSKQTPTLYLKKRASYLRAKVGATNGNTRKQSKDGVDYARLMLIRGGFIVRIGLFYQASKLKYFQIE